MPTDETSPAVPAPVPAPAEPAAPEPVAEPVKLPVGPLAKRAGQFALIGVLINVISNVVTRVLDGILVSATPAMQINIGFAELALLAITRVGLIVVIVFALRYAVQALPETRAGSGFSGRGRVIATFVLCGIFVIGLFVTAVQLVLLF